MTLDPKSELTRQWLQVATEDLDLAELANGAAPPLLSGVVYHSQQVFEKALKAFLVWHSQPVPRTHALLDLVALCQQIDPSFSSLTVPAARVSPYGTAFRYPPIAAGPTGLDALEALGLARDALAFVILMRTGTSARATSASASSASFRRSSPPSRIIPWWSCTDRPSTSREPRSATGDFSSDAIPISGMKLRGAVSSLERQSPSAARATCLTRFLKSGTRRPRSSPLRIGCRGRHGPTRPARRPTTSCRPPCRLGRSEFATFHVIRPRRARNSPCHPDRSELASEVEGSRLHNTGPPSTAQPVPSHGSRPSGALVTRPTHSPAPLGHPPPPLTQRPRLRTYASNCCARSRRSPSSASQSRPPSVASH